MRITDVINRLTAYLRDHGDVEFVTLTEVDGVMTVEIKANSADPEGN